MKVLKMLDLDLRGKRVLIREDLNVPMDNGQVKSDTRILACLPTITAALDRGAAVMLMSHLGRPAEGGFDQSFSMAPVARYLEKLLGQPVRLVQQYIGKDIAVAPGEVVLFENVRFNAGEKNNEEALARAYAALCDIYVMDAFGSAHRAQASTHGVGQVADTACAGPLLVAELDALDKALAAPTPPTVAIVGGAKVSTKLTVLSSLCNKVEQLVTGGGIANTFIAAAGYSVGKSLYEPDLVGEARQLMARAADRGACIPVPVDVVVGKAFDAGTIATIKQVSEVQDDDMIFDIGPETAAQYAALMATAGTIVWNGPLGVFEFEQFSHGTMVVGRAIADSAAFSIAGGGDTLAALEQFGLSNDISYISTGGGAFLEFLEGKQLPAVAMLESRAL